MTCALLTTGTEITRGELVNTNSVHLAEQMVSLGYVVSEMVSVADDDGQIVSTLERLAQSNDILLVTGGLGPTTDDRTALCIARVLGVPLERHEAAYQTLKELLARYGRAVSASNAKQTDLPQGAVLLKNGQGTAPGFQVQIGGCRTFCLPGVPTEMRLMFESEVIPRLPAPEARVFCVRLRTFGLPESEVNDRLAGLEEQFDLTLGYRASHSEIEVKVLARQKGQEDESALEQRAREAATEVHRRLDPYVYTEGTASLPEVLGQILDASKLSFGLAESCTGGLVSQLMTSVPGSSRYYWGGVCSYANSVKQDLLDVDAETLQTHGAVSDTVAREMAEGARKKLGVDVALSLTGIAGPAGGTPEKPVGLVYSAVAAPWGTTSSHRIFPGNRAQIQMRAALWGLWTVRQQLLSR